MQKKDRGLQNLEPWLCIPVANWLDDLTASYLVSLSLNFLNCLGFNNYSLIVSF